MSSAMQFRAECLALLDDLDRLGRDAWRARHLKLWDLKMITNREIRIADQEAMKIES